MLVFNRVQHIPSFGRLHREFNELFDSFASNGAAAAPAFAPAMNVWEDEGHYVIEADVPGFRMTDIEVSVLGDEVTIKGARTGATPENATLLRRERRDGEFERTFTLPKALASDKVEATLNDGVLRVTLPLTPEAQPRRIEVKTKTN